MKASIIFLGFDPSHQYRDSGLIISGLKKLGVDAKMITLEKDSLANAEFPFVVVQIKDENQLTTANFWNEDDSDFVIFYTWLGARKFYCDAIAAMKSAHKFVFVKSDSHGRIGFPVFPAFLSIFCERNITTAMIRLGVRFLPFRFLHTWRLQSIRTADSILIELPHSYMNLERYMRYWGCSNVFHKVSVVPNPLSELFLEGYRTDLSPKRNIVCCVARWNDSIPKNTTLVIRSIIGFLKSHPDFEAVIIGSGHEAVQKQIQSESQDILSRIQITGPIPQSEIREYFLKSKIYFLASRWESFSLSSAEALTSGCSVVSTPIDVEKSLTLGGFCGTLSDSLNCRSMIRALSLDVLKWEQGFYVPAEISEYCKNKLDEKNIANQIIRIYESRK